MTNRQAAIKIIRQLRANGFEALLAGGCVRDMLLGRAAQDHDVATSAEPADVTRIFRRTLKVGAKFGVVIVLVDNEQVEVATFRTEAGYTDGRHPGRVCFATAKEDAARRDFTINAMFYDPLKKEVIDFFGGRKDLGRRIIRTVGKPDERFAEDFLRMLRAVRFSAQLDFQIEKQTQSAIAKNACGISKISGERIAIELEGMLTCPKRSSGAAILAETGLAETIFPAFGGKAQVFGVETLKHLPGRIDYPLGLAALFAGMETRPAMAGLKTLKLSRNQMRHVEFLLASRGKLLDWQMPVSQLRIALAGPYFDDLFALQRAIQKAAGESLSALTCLQRRIRQLGDIELRPRPLLNGHDLIRLGAIPGPMVGRLAREMYIAQLEGQLHSAGQARDWAQHWLAEHRNTGMPQ